MNPILKQLLIVGVALIVGFLVGRWAANPDSASRPSQETTQLPSAAPQLENNNTSPPNRRRTDEIEEHAGNEFNTTEEVPTNQADVDALFAAIFKEPNPHTRRYRYAALLHRLTPTTAPLLWEAFNKREKLGITAHEEYRRFWDRWGEVDGPTAAALIFHEDQRFPSTLIANNTIRAWARTDPMAALTWLDAQEDLPLRTGMRQGLLEGIAQNAPEEAVRYLEAMQPNLSERARALGMIARGVASAQGIEELDLWFDALPKDAPGLDAIGNEVTALHLERGVQHAVEWAEGRRDQLPRVLDHFTTTGPDTFFGYLADRETAIGSEIEIAMDKAAVNWTKTNPDAMGHFLHRHMEAPNYDAIATKFIGAITEVDPQAAVAWTKTIRDPTLRAETLAQVKESGSSRE